MREIRFRAWDKKLEEWTSYSIDDGLLMFYDDHEECWEIGQGGERFILCQYTGLKSINGEEIYEGDIVRAVGFSKWIGVAKYSDKNQAFVFESTDKNYRGNIVFMSQLDQGFKILGNIYENPELLEEAVNVLTNR